MLIKVFYLELMKILYSHRNKDVLTAELELAHKSDKFAHPIL